ncbi:MAG: ribbon-helix-helix domain-containing protein [Thermoanaerobaculia bacterium]
MGDLKRATVYFEPELHRALRLQAAETERSLSELVNEAVRRALGADADDVARLRARQDEPAFSFELVLRNLRRRGAI